MERQAQPTIVCSSFALSHSIKGIPEVRIGAE